MWRRGTCARALARGVTLDEQPYLYVDRDRRKWGVGMVADIEAPGCIFHDAQVSISDDGIDVEGKVVRGLLA